MALNIINTHPYIAYSIFTSGCGDFDNFIVQTFCDRVIKNDDTFVKNVSTSPFWANFGAFIFTQSAPQFGFIYIYENREIHADFEIAENFAKGYSKVLLSNIFGWSFSNFLNSLEST
jgi:hypothetical protein